MVQRSNWRNKKGIKLLNKEFRTSPSISPSRTGARGNSFSLDVKDPRTFQLPPPPEQPISYLSSSVFIMDLSSESTVVTTVGDEISSVVEPVGSVELAPPNPPYSTYDQRPTYRVSDPLMNNEASIHFDENNYETLNASASVDPSYWKFMSDGTGGTCVVACNIVGVQSISGYVVFTGGSSASGGGFNIRVSGGGTLYYRVAGAFNQVWSFTVSSAITLGDPYVIAVRMHSGSAELRLNGQVVASSTSPLSTFTGSVKKYLTLFAGATDTGAMLTGSLSYLGMWDRYLTDEEIEEIETYAINKWVLGQ